MPIKSPALSFCSRAVVGSALLPLRRVFAERRGNLTRAHLSQTDFGDELKRLNRANRSLTGNVSHAARSQSGDSPNNFSDDFRFSRYYPPESPAFDYSRINARITPRSYEEYEFAEWRNGSRGIPALRRGTNASTRAST
jgi:hypothetical protein